MRRSVGGQGKRLLPQAHFSSNAYALFTSLLFPAVLERDESTLFERTDSTGAIRRLYMLQMYDGHARGIIDAVDPQSYLLVNNGGEHAEQADW